MKKHNETTPASTEDMQSIHWEELDAMRKTAEERIEAINAVPINLSAEKYLRDRYPVGVLFSRFQLQELAATHFSAALCEEEMQEVCAEFYDEYPHEIEEAIVSAIEKIIAAR